MNHLTVRCLGGLEIRLDDRQITAFESHKVRALFAYLIVQRDRSFSREHLAALFWPEKSGAAARRNLRQAIYNLKSALGVTKNGASIILAQGGDLQFDAELDCWLDVDTFETSRQQGLAKGTVGPHQLTAAVALYRGDFLAGFSLKDSPDFELWQLAMQERLRDQALESISTLVENYLSRGEFRIGLQYARRWVGLDPLSEEAHRYLMRLHALCGQRTRSLAHYEELCETLASELGVEPLEETQELYEVLLKEQALPPPEDEEEEKGIGPLIPLVGRQDSYQALRDCWRSVLDQGSQMTLVEGEPGIGKMRLVKSFLDATGSQRLITILQGRCSQWVPTSFQPFAQVLRNAIAEDGERVRKTLDGLDAEDLAGLSLIVPELEDLLPSLPPISVSEGPVGHRRLFGCIGRILEDFCRSPDGKNLSEPLILLLGDLQWACCETAELIEHLLTRLPAAPVWIIATSCPDHPPGASPILDRLRDSESTRASSIALERLDSAAIEELAASFVDDHQSVELARFLSTRSAGLPLAIAEWINLLWDEGILEHDAGRWRLSEPLTCSDLCLTELVRQRLHRLPSSTRRLAAQAAIMGQAFDARLVQESADEHPKVVEVGLELMLERWLIRQHSQYWMSGRREHDIVLWDKGARRGHFEFNHRLIWQSIYEDTNPLRRQIMHREIGVASEAGLGDAAERFCERLAFHHIQATAWDRAIVRLRQAIRHAECLQAADTERYYLDQASAVLAKLAASARTATERQRWQQERETLNERLDCLKSCSPG